MPRISIRGLQRTKAVGVCAMALLGGLAGIAQAADSAPVKRSILSAFVFLILINRALADDISSPQHQMTSPPSSARFEMVQSPLAAKWTFRLDRYSGRVWQLVRTNDNNNAWEEIPVLGLPKTPATARPHFQIFTSGLAARHTFLIDNDTGKTWVVGAGKRKSEDGSEYEVNVWQPLAD